MIYDKINTMILQITDRFIYYFVAVPIVFTLSNLVSFMVTYSYSIIGSLKIPKPKNELLEEKNVDG